MSRKPPPLLRRKSSAVSDFIRRRSFIDDDVKEMKDLFAMCDSNSDGVVSKKELLQMMKNMGIEPTKAEFTKLWEQLDTNGDGELSFNEFLSGMRWLQKGLALADDIEEDEEGEAEEAATPVAPGSLKDMENKVNVLTKYVQMVIETGVKRARDLAAAGNTAGAQEVLDVLDMAVVTEIEKAISLRLVPKELRVAYNDLQKTLGKK